MIDSFIIACAINVVIEVSSNPILPPLSLCPRSNNKINFSSMTKQRNFGVSQLIFFEAFFFARFDMDFKKYYAKLLMI